MSTLLLCFTLNFFYELYTSSEPQGVEGAAQDSRSLYAPHDINDHTPGAPHAPSLSPLRAYVERTLSDMLCAQVVTDTHACMLVAPLLFASAVYVAYLVSASGALTSRGRSS